METKTKQLTWSEIVLFAVGSLAGALLGVIALSRLIVAMQAQAPGFWFVSRAAGIVGYALLWVATAWGVMLSARDAGPLVSGPLAYTLHNVTSWLALVFSAIHALALLGDRIVPFTVRGVFVPFTADYQTFLSGLGTLALYVGIVVSAAFYLKKRIGYRTWRTIHGLSYVMFVAVTIHSVLLGTDSGTSVMRVAYLLAGGSVLFLTLYRILTVGAARKKADEPQAA